MVIVAGFQGMSSDYDITTLGRGGSDTTACALTAALSAEYCEIFTDVNGVYTCLLYTSDAADDLLCVDLGGRRVIKKKNKQYQHL